MMEPTRERRTGEIWKEGRVWKVQFPKGIWTVNRKRKAVIISQGFFGEKIRKEGREI